jgi:hypothetical protein
MNTKAKLALLGIPVGFLFLIGLIVTAMSFSQASIFGSAPDCSFQPVTVENQTFSSISEFKQGVERNGGDWSEVNESVRFRVEDGTLQYKLNETNCEQLQVANE